MTASRSAPGPKEQRRAQHRELSRVQILDAAEEVFARKGFHDATVKEIAATAEFSVGGVYSFFAEKDDIFVQIFERRGSEFMQGMRDVLEGKLIKRQVPLKGLTYGTIEPAAGSTVRQTVTLQQGIAIEKAREIVKAIKDSKKKVQASIQGDLVRVNGKDRDSLQEIIALLRGRDFGIDMQFTNYRSN